jgi:malate synthase
MLDAGNGVNRLEVRGDLARRYPDVLTNEAITALGVLAPLNAERLALMSARLQRRARRVAEGGRIAFLDPHELIPGTTIRVQDARDGRFEASEIPPCLSGSGSRAPARRRGPAPPLDTSLRNVAYALLSGADGWMFDGEDALGQVQTMSLDNQRNLHPGHRPRTALLDGSPSRWPAR